MTLARTTGRQATGERATGRDTTEKTMAEDKMAGENFPVALRVLPARVRADLVAVYRYARFVDDLGDALPGDREVALKTAAEDVRAVYAGEVPQQAEVAGIADLARRGVPPDPWLRLVEANLLDQRQDRYPTFGDLLDYCVLSANPVGEIVLHVFGQATPERVALSDRICTGLQIVEHLQDIGEDYRAGRIYLPGEDLARFGVDESAFARPRADPALRALVAFETDRALAWLNSGAMLVPTLHGWARVAVSAYLNGGRAAAAGLRRAGFDPLAGVPKPTRRQVAATWLRESVRRPG
jgi:squalene synthase HpnC